MGACVRRLMFLLLEEKWGTFSSPREGGVRLGKNWSDDPLCVCVCSCISCVESIETNENLEKKCINSSSFFFFLSRPSCSIHDDDDREHQRRMITNPAAGYGKLEFPTASEKYTK